jgi:hypothetical protein
VVDDLGLERAWAASAEADVVVAVDAWERVQF